jgi:peptidoglycan/LPS O-acetylase OafA/YrhL
LVARFKEQLIATHEILPVLSPTVDSPKRPPKDEAVQSLRGIAILLMVAGHVIGATAVRGMEVADDSAWRLADVALEDIRMPLFTVISGFVYAMRPIRTVQHMPGLLRAKARRLMLPLLTVGTALFVLELSVPGTHLKLEPHELWRVYAMPYEHLWFLQAIFLVFLVVGFLDGFGLLKTPRRALLAMLVSVVMLLAIPVPPNADVFSVGGALHLLPFFLMGYVLNRYRLLDDWRWVFAAAPAFLLLYSVRMTTILDLWHPAEPVDRIIGLGVAVSGISLLFLGRNIVRARWLAWIGGFAFSIYLLHVFGTSAVRIALKHLGVTSAPAVFALCLMAGVAGPIVFQRVFGRYRPISMFVLGEKPAKVSADSSGAV